MIGLSEAHQRILAGCHPLPEARVDLDRAQGLVLAEDLVAELAIPPFASSAMDGYAVRSADVCGASEASPIRLRVIGTIAAGSSSRPEVGPGEAVRIMTGAPFPPGADAVAIVELTRSGPSSSGSAADVAQVGAAPAGSVSAGSAPAGPAEWVDVMVAAEGGIHVRPAGEDLAAGTLAFSSGTQLGPGHLGVIASLGRPAVRCIRRPVVGVLSTGDELVPPGTALGYGQIYDSNRRSLLGLLRRDGFEGVDLGVAVDEESDIRRRISEGAARCDAIMTSGGVSMGAFDYVRKILEEMAAMNWMQVAIRPAKPFAFGTIGETPVFGLPGNPVSSMISYELLARPGLRRLAGFDDTRLHRPRLRARTASALSKPDPKRTSFVRVRASWDASGRLQVGPTGGQASNLLFPMAVANALAVVPPGVRVVEGEEIEVILLGEVDPVSA